MGLQEAQLQSWELPPLMPLFITTSEFCVPSFFRLTKKYYLFLRVVLRDVPKDASIKDIASLFPEAVSYFLYDKTFPASKFWYFKINLYYFREYKKKNRNYLFTSHAALRFKNTERVAEILKCKFLNIAGKKVYVFPAYEELLCENPQLGEPEPVAVEVKEVAIDVNNRLILSNQS